MTKAAGPNPRPKASLVYWIVAVFALVWNSFGCTDFAMTVTRDPGYIAHLPPEMIDWLDAVPTWTIFTWALGVWGGLVGALLLLVRSRWAVYAFGASLVGLAASQFWQFSTGLPESMTTPANIAMSITIWIVAIGLLVYAARMRARGVLR